jgi:hypothetical protein
VYRDESCAEVEQMSVEHERGTPAKSTSVQHLDCTHLGSSGCGVMHAARALAESLTRLGCAGLHHVKGSFCATLVSKGPPVIMRLSRHITVPEVERPMLIMHPCTARLRAATVGGHTCCMIIAVVIAIQRPSHESNQKMQL